MAPVAAPTQLAATPTRMQTEKTIMDLERTFKRDGDFVLFNQYGLKLDFYNATSDATYYDWLDEMISHIGVMVRGASILEKVGDRTEPRRNTGVYYDTQDYRLLAANMVLRTTSNPKTHAFCAFKLGEDNEHVRRDHRHIFDGDEKATIQRAPTSPEAEGIVKRLLGRTDIMQPGIYLEDIAGISGSELSQSLCLAQYRRTFYVLLDGCDALRCSLDRVDISNLRLQSSDREQVHFSEVEVPIYPRITPDVAKDPRLRELIDTISTSLRERFKVRIVTDSKYRRAARLLGLPYDDSDVQPSRQ
jgi:hypothetical protein